MNLDKEIAVLVISFFALCVIAVALTANSKAVVSSIESTYKTPSEKLLSEIQAIQGCYYENQTQVSHSPINGGKDYLILIRCVE